jgi:ADP-ribosyl-[dinitrogen reductase] hydrolase
MIRLLFWRPWDFVRRVTRFRKRRAIRHCLAWHSGYIFGVNEASVIGCLLGTAVGDALGLCCEGLSPRRQRRLFPDVQYHFLPGRGMVSDDTEHACLTAQALIASAADADVFIATLARSLRRWFLALPAATGWATLRACLRLCLGFSPRHSGVFSAGNGPAMRSPILGVCHGHDVGRLRELVRLCTRITHVDPKSEYGALAIAWAAYLSSATGDAIIRPGDYCASLRMQLGSDGRELLDLIERAAASVENGQTTSAFAAELGLQRGVSGYMYHTVPVVLHAWFRNSINYRAAIVEMIRCGGDTDTTAAMLGGILGARVGKPGIPAEWLTGLWEWPRSVSWMEQLGRQLAEVCQRGQAQQPVAVALYKVLPRNLFFLAVVLLHGLRRVLPPY